MKLDLSLHNYVDWEVKPVIALKGKFGYRVILRYMDGSEKVQQKSGFRTDKEAAKVRETTIGELHAGTYIVYANVKVAEFMSFWLEDDIQRRVESYETYRKFESIVRLHIVPFIGKKKMIDINRGTVQKLYNDRAEYSQSVAKLVKTIMNISFNYAMEKKIIAENPASGINLPKRIKAQPFHIRNIDTRKTLTMEQIQTLLEASRETPIHMQVLFNVLMGLRRCEINGVKYSDIDFVNRTLKLQRQLGIKMNTKKEDFAPKTYTKQEVRMKTPSSYRTLPIPDYVFEAILEQREIYEKNKRRRPAEFQDLGYICCSSYGRPRSKDYHWEHYKKLLQDNNLPDIRWHDLRSTFCTLLLKNDFNPKAVAKLMGHAKELITMDVYGDNKGIIEDCIEELQPFIDEVMPGADIDQDDELLTENMDIVIPVETYLNESNLCMPC